MSNIEASKLYEAIIEEVINDSRQDFENSGVDENTLQELKRIWQEKLTQSQVSKFSWDSDQNQSLNINSNSNSMINPNLPNYRSDLQHNLLINNNYGISDQQLSYNNDVNQNDIQDDIGLQLPISNDQPTFKDEYDDNGGLMLPTVGQTDGPNNFELTIETIDGKKLLKKLVQVDGELGLSDGEDDNLFNDSDDINSDLDDELDTDKSDDEDNDLDGHIMLCLYDKVQRIKNKWKCSLKEGVASINGKDYVFQKANGESEW